MLNTGICVFIIMNSILSFTLARRLNSQVVVTSVNEVYYARTRDTMISDSWETLRDTCQSTIFKISILWHNGLFHMFLGQSPKTTQKYPKLISLQHFEVDIPKNFQKWKYSFFSIFSNFFSTYAWVSQIASHFIKIIHYALLTAHFYFHFPSAFIDSSINFIDLRMKEKIFLFYNFYIFCDILNNFLYHTLLVVYLFLSL